MCTSTSATPPEASGTIAGEARAPAGRRALLLASAEMLNAAFGGQRSIQLSYGSSPLRGG